MSDIQILQQPNNKPCHRATRIAVTGGIGVGKSAVSQMLAEMGALVISADKLAADVLREQAAVIAERFHHPQWAIDGIDRKKLAEIVFHNEAKRSELEAITHPEIRKKAAEFFVSLQSEQIGVYDIPLLHPTLQCADNSDTAVSSFYDLVIVVTAPLEQRYRRLWERSGFSKAEVDSRIAAQISDAERNKMAHVVINNTGSVGELRKIVVNHLWSVILGLRDN